MAGPAREGLQRRPAVGRDPGQLADRRELDQRWVDRERGLRLERQRRLAGGEHRPRIGRGGGNLRLPTGLILRHGGRCQGQDDDRPVGVAQPAGRQSRKQGNGSGPGKNDQEQRRDETTAPHGRRLPSSRPAAPPTASTAVTQAMQA
jgi:hypothetical protein